MFSFCSDKRPCPSIKQGHSLAHAAQLGFRRRSVSVPLSLLFGRVMRCTHATFGPCKPKEPKMDEILRNNMLPVIKCCAHKHDLFDTFRKTQLLNPSSHFLLLFRGGPLGFLKFSNARRGRRKKKKRKKGPPSKLSRCPCCVSVCSFFPLPLSFPILLPARSTWLAATCRRRRRRGRTREVLTTTTTHILSQICPMITKGPIPLIPSRKHLLRLKGGPFILSFLQFFFSFGWP